MPSRVAKNPITIPTGVDVKIENQLLIVKGSKGTLEKIIPSGVQVKKQDNLLQIVADDAAANSNALSGTMRTIADNMVKGVTKGFEKKLTLVGVGYRAQAQGKILNLTLGFSHPINFPLPEGITAETPTQTEIIIKGMDSQKVGEVCAQIREIRPPEPYKGKGVRFADETITLKEAKKK